MGRAMNFIKAMILSFAILLTYEAWSSDSIIELEPYPNDSTECSLTQCSLLYLEDRPKANWRCTALASVGALLSLGIGIVPPLILCTHNDKDYACGLTERLDPLVGFGGLIASIVGIGLAAKDAIRICRSRVCSLQVVKLIKEAYEVRSKSLGEDNMISVYLSNNQNRYIMDENTIESLAEKIRIAAETGFFVPIEAAYYFKDERLSPYSQYEDTPKFHDILKADNCENGRYINVETKNIAEPQNIVDNLLKIPLNDLKMRNVIIKNLLNRWNNVVVEFISKAKKQQEMRDQR
jgi:hypothetical protein